MPKARLANLGYDARVREIIAKRMSGTGVLYHGASI